jgi:phosphohistidine phosphatase
MKTLHIVRHGKSSWDYPGIPDIDRPLIDKGISNSYLMAEKFLKKHKKPALIYSSPAIRALHTAVIFTRTLKLSPSIIKINEKIYEGSTGSIISVIEETKSNINDVMVFGHNPIFTQLANLFLNEKIDNLPTTGIVTLTFDTDDWSIYEKLPLSAEVDFPKNE